MGRPTLLSHLKFRRLVKALGNRALALGTLELIWAHAYETGDPHLGTAADVALICDWAGPDNRIANILAETGFLDHENGTYLVHDLFDHAPQYVQRRMERELARRARGQSLGDIRRQAAIHGKQTSSHLQQLSSRRSTNDSTPAPAPAPAPNTTPLPPPLEGVDLPPLPGMESKAHPEPAAKGPRRARKRASDFGEGVMALIDLAAALWPEMQPGGKDRVPAMAPVLFAQRINHAISHGYSLAEVEAGMRLYAEEMTLAGSYFKAPQYWLGLESKAPGWAYLDAAKALHTKETQ